MTWLETHVVLDLLDKQNQKDADAITKDFNSIDGEIAAKDAANRNRERADQAEMAAFKAEMAAFKARLDADSVPRRTMVDAVNAEQAAKVPGLEKEVAYYKALLCKPMLEIAQENGDFKATYLKQQEIFSQWIVSQHAYKELAMEYGEKLGKSPAQVEADSKTMAEKVINNTTKFDNGVSQDVLSNLDNSEKVAEIKTQKEAEEKEKNRLAEEKERKIKEDRERFFAESAERVAKAKARKEAEETARVEAEEAAKAEAEKKSKWKIWK